MFSVMVCSCAVIQLQRYHCMIGRGWQYAVIQKSLLWRLPALGLHGPTWAPQQFTATT